MFLPCFHARPRRSRAAAGTRWIEQRGSRRPGWEGGREGRAQEGDLHAIPRAGDCAGAGPQRGGHAGRGAGIYWLCSDQERLAAAAAAGDGEPRLGSPNLTRAHMEPAHSSASLSYFIAAPAACAPSLSLSPFNPLKRPRRRAAAAGTDWY